MALTNRQIDVLTGTALCLLIILSAAFAYLSGKYPLEAVGMYLLMFLPVSAVPLLAAIEPRN